MNYSPPKSVTTPDKRVEDSPIRKLWLVVAVVGIALPACAPAVPAVGYVEPCDPVPFGSDLAEQATDVERLGPVILFPLGYVSDFTSSDFSEVEGEYRAHKQVAQISGASDVVLEVSSESTTEAVLIFDSSKWVGLDDNHLPLEAGSPAVRFAACEVEGGPRQAVGGMLVTGPGCVVFRVFENHRHVGDYEVAFGASATCP